MTCLKGKIFKGIFFIVIPFGLLINNSFALAGDRLFLAGVEGGNGTDSLNHYTFIAVIAPFLNNNLGNGFVQKYWVDFIGYDYVADNETIKAIAPAVEGALGYQMSGPKWWSSVYAGIRYSNTHLSPDNPDSSTRGDQTRIKLQVEGERTIASQFKINAICSYILRSDSYYVRWRGSYRIYNNEIYTGPEVVVMGDPDYRIWQWGWVIAGFKPASKWTVGVKAGIKKIINAHTGVYLGLEFTGLF